MSQFNQNFVFSGLGTQSVTVPNAATYFVDVQSTIPTLVNGGGVSALQVLVKLNGATKYTGVAGASGAQTFIPCAAGDVIAVVFSSANAVDNALNAIKSVIAVSQGDAA